MMGEGVRRMDALVRARRWRPGGWSATRRSTFPSRRRCRRGGRGRGPKPATRSRLAPTRSRSRRRRQHLQFRRWPICALCRASSGQARRSIKTGGISYVLVSYRGGDIAAAGGAVGRAAGWQTSAASSSHAHAGPDRSPPAAAAAAAAGTQPAASSQPQPGERSMKPAADQIALPLDWPQTEGDARFIVIRRQPRSVRPFPQVEHVAGQGDDADRSAPVGAHAAGPQLRRAGRRPAVRRCRSSATRRSCSTPGTRPRTAAGHWS